jgi:hypothetical protein
MKSNLYLFLIGIFFITLLLAGCNQQSQKQLTDEQVENIVRRSYQYVALYNVNNKFALDAARRTGTNGWNIVMPDTQLKDHNFTEIARPNNDTQYIICMLDLRKDAIILEIPAFDSKYVSLMCTAYDHYVNIPVSTRLGDFRKPEKVLFYTARTEGYRGEQVEGIDRIYEMSGDFVSAAFRVMPHANEQQRFKKIIKQMKAVKAISLSEFKGNEAKLYVDPMFPTVGKTDADVFKNNLLEVMQFVFNHLTFDPNDEMDNSVLAAYKPLGIEPGKKYNKRSAYKIDGKKFREISEKIKDESLATMQDPSIGERLAPKMFQPKDKTDLETIVALSVIGPIGQPMQEAMYPPVSTADGKPMNAMNDYIIRMSKDQLPPAKAFWSLTLYDSQNGFFIPNDRKKYSVGENAGFKLNKNGGIEVYVAADKPQGIPEENWLPINRGDQNLDIILRIYNPDLEKIKNWQAPKAEILKM